jgi:hypothetical protein
VLSRQDVELQEIVVELGAANICQASFIHHPSQFANRIFPMMAFEGDFRPELHRNRLMDRLSFGNISSVPIPSDVRRVDEQQATRFQMLF